MRKVWVAVGLLLLGVLPLSAHSDEMKLAYHYPLNPSECPEMTVWDVGTAMCMPLPMPGMPMQMLMIHGNAFVTGITEEGPRGRSRAASPNMFMVDYGQSAFGDRHYLNLDLMLTAEKWTFPSGGYPELLQVGETDAQGNPYIDAQHPHSSPIMGLTFSDTIKLDTGGETDHLKLSFAPRGESADGPVAFMHRATAMANPDAPLGHHIGQDVGHISSTVFAGALQLGQGYIEASAFNGTEPEPTALNIPLGTPNSYAVRYTQEFSPRVMAMASVAYVKNPEPNEPEIPYVMRYSTSIYTNHPLSKNWQLYNTVIFGLITQYDHASSLSSFDEEFWLFNNARSRFFGRLEVVQRTPQELAVPIVVANPSTGRWVAAATLGYTYAAWKLGDGELGIGASGTKDFLPNDYSRAYGGNPWSGRVFLQGSGMKMFEL